MAFDNTVSSELTLAKIMDLVLEEFVSELLPIKAFSLGVTGGRTLNALGTKTLQVPYISAVSAASKDFDAAAGDCYETDATTTTNREIVVNKRKYQSWGITSEQSAVNPILNSIDFAKQKARKLAADVLADILSVIDDTNFPNETATGAASGYDVDLMIDIREDANGFKMPKMNRSAILKDAPYSALLKDSKDASVQGSTNARWDGSVPRIAGFDVYDTTSGLDGATDIDGGIVVFPSAILVAMAPLEPLAKVRQALADFKVFTHPESGISLVYKAIVDPKCDELIELVECTYGFAKGEEDALIRLVTS